MASELHRPFVGRAAELESLAMHVAAASDGAGRVVLVTGEAGIGKTRTIEQALAELPPAQVLWGRCHESGGAPAYWPWVQALRPFVRELGAARVAEILGGAVADVARVLPVGAASASGLPDGGGAPLVTDSDEARFRLFDALSTFLHAVAADRLLVIVLEDLHWADQESLLLLRYVAPELRGAKLLVLGTVRESELREQAGVPHFLGDLARRAFFIQLGALAPAEIAEYAAAVAGTAGEATVAAIHRATAGNAFLVTELVDLLYRDRRLDAELVRGRLVLPAGLRETVLHRLHPLDRDVRSLLDLAAVAGHAIDLAVLARASGRDPAELLRTLSPAIALGVLADTPATPGRLRFVHNLVADALVEETAPDVRAQYNRAIGEAMEIEHAAQLDEVAGEIAQHFFAAASLGKLERAIELAWRAGDRAVTLLGFEEAAAHYRRAALSAAATPFAPAKRLALQTRLAYALLTIGDDDGARSAALEAARLAREVGDRRRFAWAGMIAGAARSETGRPDGEVIAVLEEAVREFESNDRELLATVLPVLSREIYFVDRARRHELSLQALELAREIGQPRILIGALSARHLALWEPGTAEERLALIADRVSLADQSPDLQVELHTYAWWIADLLEIGDVDRAEEVLRRYETLAARRRMPRLSWHVAVARASRALRIGALDEAEEIANLAAATWPAGPQNNVAQFHAIQIYFVRREQGRLGELDAAVQAFAAASPVPAWRATLAALHAELGRPDEARRVVREMGARSFVDLPIDGNWLPTVANLALACAAVGEREAAEQLLPRVEPLTRSFVVIGAGVACLGSVARYAGLLAQAAGRLDEAARHLEAAIEANRRIGALPELAHTQVDLARLRRTAGDARGAAQLEASAAETARKLGLAAVLAALGDRVPDESAGAPAREAVAPAAVSRTSQARMCRDGDVWTVAYGDESTHVKHMKGMEYLVRLISEPDRELHALDVGGHDAGGLPGDGGEVLDAEARRAYRARLDSLREQLDEADQQNDIGRSDAIRDEMEVIASELTRAVGLHGRARRSGSVAERARLNVTRAIRKAIARIAEDCPALGRHLERCIETGRLCSYRAALDAPVWWQL